MLHHHRASASRPARRRTLSGGCHVQALESRRLFAATLIQDLDTRPGNDARPLQVTESAGVGYFSHSDGQSGVELWRSDGTAGGTWQVKDINPGPEPSAVGLVQNSIVDAGGTLFFSASDGRNGHELWKSDGTEAGTVMVADIRPGPADSYPAHMVAAGSGVYFFADNGVTGIELWHSDGTPQGTSLVKDVRPGAAGQVPRLGVAGPDGSFFFYGSNGAPNSTGSGVWHTDGTAAGTVLLRSGAEGLTTTATPMAYAGGYTYVVDGIGDLWRSDGTRAGTVKVEEDGSDAGFITEMLGVGGNLYYVRAINPTSDRRGSLWVRSGGTSTRVTDTASINPITRAGRLADVNGTLYFAASNDAAGSELWRASLVTRATMVRDATPGRAGTNPLEITHVGATVYLHRGHRHDGVFAVAEQRHLRRHHARRDVERGHSATSTD